MDRKPRTVRIAYIGAERVGLACLKRLVRLKKNVVGVFTADAVLKPRVADFASFDRFARSGGIPTVFISDPKDSKWIRSLRRLKPDLILVISWSFRIPSEVLSLPRLGCVGLHYSLLPRRRGGAPLFWMIRDGLKESGLSLYHLDHGIDTGDVIAQKKICVTERDTPQSLLDKIGTLAPDLLEENIGLLERETAPRIRQNSRRATTTPARIPSESLIQGPYSLKGLHRFIRALAPPYPSAYTHVAGRKLTIPSAELKGERLWIEGYIE